MELPNPCHLLERKSTYFATDVAVSLLNELQTDSRLLYMPRLRLISKNQGGVLGRSHTLPLLRARSTFDPHSLALTLGCGQFCIDLLVHLGFKRMVSCYFCNKRMHLKTRTYSILYVKGNGLCLMCCM